jgi:D-sedoheptulose 7-phosphate isomerase
VPDLEGVVAAGFARRRTPVARLAEDAEELARTCRDLAERFTAGGRLLVFGNGAGTTDAQHVAVEFVHPVIVGKRALPALSLVSDAATLMGVATRRGLVEVYAHQVEVLGRPHDIALGLSGDGCCANVRSGLRAAREAGMLTVALLGGDGGDVLAKHEADHTLVVRSQDPLVVKKVTSPCTTCCGSWCTCSWSLPRHRRRVAGSSGCTRSCTAAARTATPC